MEKVLVDSEGLDRMLLRLSHEILEKNPDTSEIALVGILRRGATLADTLAENINKIIGKKIEVGYLDITLYRDDLSELSEKPKLNKTQIPFDVTAKTIIIVDDVIFTGRTVRAAIDAIFDCGRPKRIQLLELVDRGHRELPIKPDYVGKNIPTSLDEVIMVKVRQYDGEQCVAVINK